MKLKANNVENKIKKRNYIENGHSRDRNVAILASCILHRSKKNLVYYYYHYDYYSAKSESITAQAT